MPASTASRPVHQVLPLLVVLLWGGCFALGVRTVLRGSGFPPFVVSSAAAGDYPILSNFVLSGEGRSGLQVGDRLIRLGEGDLRGVGPVDFAGRAAEAGGSGRLVAVVFERAGERSQTTLRLVSYVRIWPLLLVSLVFAITGVLLLLRARPSPVVRAWFHALLWCAIGLASRFGGSRREVYASVAVTVASATLFGPLACRAVVSVVPDTAARGRFVRAWPWLFAAVGLLMLLFVLGVVPYDVWLRSTYALVLLLGITFLDVATRIYRGLDPVGRRQAKWLLLGGYLALAPRLAVAAWVSIDPGVLDRPVYVFTYLSLLMLPLCLGIAVARYNVFDIDRLLSATASYNILLVVLLGGAFLLAPRVAEAASAFLGIDPLTGQIALSLALAGAVIPAHRRLRPRIDQLFFKERFALDRGIAELLPALASATDARDLTQRAGGGIHRLFRPEACVVYAGVDASYVPVFAEGRAVPPAFDAMSPLIRTLSERTVPLALVDAGRRPDETSLSPFDRAALETLDAEVVLPVHREGALAAFLCLGPKRSGDVYTSTDLSLLVAVGGVVSEELRRFDQEEAIRQAREMQRSLRRYVPGAVAEQLASGIELEPSIREVTVLFVDIRGYTGFAERHRVEEIFSVVNRYTEAVSGLVRKHGGSVVEFNGDGMMAVFGAPRDLPHKERAAVDAGREISDAVEALELDHAEGGGTRLAVGVGIATGEACVGSIRAVDRMIWSAIGDTTNLAARLQALCPQLDAALVIDAATCERLGAMRGEFHRHPAIVIRGRRQPQDVFTLRPDPARASRAAGARTV